MIFYFVLLFFNINWSVDGISCKGENYHKIVIIDYQTHNKSTEYMSMFLCDSFY